MAKQKFYDIKRLLEINAQYNILLGERSNGKSFQVKKHAIEKYLRGEGKVIYLRRFTVEVKPNMVEEYFNDENLNYKKMTNGKYDGVMCYRGLIYFFYYGENDERIRGESFGKYVALSTERQQRSLSLTEYTTIIYEEFITMPYLQTECRDLMHFVSTVARRNIIQVFMIGNTISRLCPYFSEWQLTHIPQQKMGDIDIYKMSTNQVDENGEKIYVTIAVELCANSGNNSKMFFGQASKMITSGVWEADEQHHLINDYKSYNCIYKITVINMNMMYCIEWLKNDNGESFLYCHPTNKIKTKRIISNDWSEDMFTTKKLFPICKGDLIIRKLISLGKICYSDNLTGSEFSNIIKDII